MTLSGSRRRGVDHPGQYGSEQERVLWASATRRRRSPVQHLQRLHMSWRPVHLGTISRKLVSEGDPFAYPPFRASASRLCRRLHSRSSRQRNDYHWQVRGIAPPQHECDRRPFADSDRWGAVSTTEHTINDALAWELRKTRHAWRRNGVVESEQLGMLQDSAARPDVLVVEPNVSPVAVEVEVLPALTVEADAGSRLGQRLRQTGRPILATVAVRLPLRMRDKQGDDLRAELSIALDIDMALLTGSDPAHFARWPQSGWIVGGIADLSVLAQMASVPPSVIDEAVDRLVAGVQGVAGLLSEMVVDHAGSVHQISTALCQEDGEQTRRMAGTILANAFVFHEILAGGQGALERVHSIEQVRGSADGLTKSAILAEWRKILEVNYWPIFDIARRILEAVPAENARSLLDVLAHTADQLLETRLMRSHDLTGAVFQRLIADRKFLAAFYTTPASASLLAGLAVTPRTMSGGRSWSKPGACYATAHRRLRMRHWDFAFGCLPACRPAARDGRGRRRSFYTQR